MDSKLENAIRKRLKTIVPRLTTEYKSTEEIRLKTLPKEKRRGTERSVNKNYARVRLLLLFN